MPFGPTAIMPSSLRTECQYRIAWFHAGLACAVLEQNGVFAVASVYDGQVKLDDLLVGRIAHPGPSQLVVAATGSSVWLGVEGVGLSESEVSDILVHLRD
jgi:hypothetical protein